MPTCGAHTITGHVGSHSPRTVRLPHQQPKVARHPRPMMPTAAFEKLRRQPRTGWPSGKPIRAKLHGTSSASISRKKETARSSQSTRRSGDKSGTKI